MARGRGKWGRGDWLGVSEDTFGGSGYLEGHTEGLDLFFLSSKWEQKKML